MNKDEFWALIALGQGSVSKLADLPVWLQNHLMSQTDEYLADYHRNYETLSALSYDAKLWAAANLILKFCSDDKFTDFRAWLVAKGRLVFENALNNPDSLADESMDGDHGLPILFRMGNVAERTYRAKNNELADITDLVPGVSEFVLHNSDAWDGDQKKLSIMFPRLFEKFGTANE